MTHWVIDYETLVNCTVAVFEHYKTQERKVFVVHDLQDEFDNLVDFLHRNKQEKEWHISYNGLAFDAQISHFILNNYRLWLTFSACRIANIIYNYAQECIKKSRAKSFQDYPQWKMSIGQIDLFKMHHWDNPAKMSSLKWIQFSMDYDNILDMPIEHTTEIKTKEQIDTIVKYCINDVESTKEIFNNSQSQIKLRKDLTKTYNVDLFSASEPRISKELFAHYMSDKLNISKREIKQMRTHRDVIRLKDIILPYIKFSSPQFRLMHDRFESLELDPYKLKGSFKYAINYKDVPTHFGLGGVHGARKPGVYKSDDEYVIMSSDVTSFYPNLVIRNNWSPEHFPKDEFCSQYEWCFNERKKIPKSNSMNYVYKIILNSTFGLSNDQNSFFYDPELCMRITVNGQLTLMMLYEMIMERIPGALALMQNTDGIETRIPREHIDEYLAICKEWEEITNLNLEHDQYQKLILADVNNYIGLNDFKHTDLTTWRNIKKEKPHYLFKVSEGKFLYAETKMKGRFNFHNLALHKNKSKLIIRKAIFYYFIHGVLPQKFLETNRDILDYCIGGKSKGDWKQIARSIKDGEVVEEGLQKINRYYISNNGPKIIKRHKIDKREIQLEAGKWKQTLLNKMIVKPKWEDYDVNINYYLKGIESEIDKIMSVPTNQLVLF